MNRKITFPELTSLLASHTGESNRTCELFLKNFFASISSALASGETVKIKGLGTFRLNEIESRKSVNVNTGLEFEIPGHRRVTFVAAPTLAERLNEPFLAFESVEISDNVTDEMLEALELPDDSRSESQTEQDIVPAGQSIEPAAGEESEENCPGENEEEISDVPAVEEHESTQFIGGGFSFVSDEPDAIPEASSGDSVDNDAAGNQSDPELSAVQEAGPEPDAFSYNLEDTGDDLVPSQREEESSSVTDGLKPDTVYVPVEEMNPPSSQTPAAEEPVVMQPFTDTAAEPEPQPLSDIKVKELPVRKKGNFGRGFIAGLLTCVIIGAVALAIYYNSSSQEEMAQAIVSKDTVSTATQPVAADTASAASAATDTADVEPAEKDESIEPLKDEAEAHKEKEKVADTKPSDAPVYDTITKTRYLTTMAKEHYGNYHLWPYIYEANKSLGHPDRIRPGTKVVVPSLAKLGVNPDNPNDIAAAKRKGVKIYSRYKK